MDPAQQFAFLVLQMKTSHFTVVNLVAPKSSNSLGKMTLSNGSQIAFDATPKDFKAIRKLLISEGLLQS